MPPRKKKTPVEIVTIRLSDAEQSHVDGELAKLKAATGIPFSRGAYAKHATLEHAGLRKLETLIKSYMSSANGNVHRALSAMLAEAGR